MKQFKIGDSTVDTVKEAVKVLKVLGIDVTGKDILAGKVAECQIVDTDGAPAPLVPTAPESPEPTADPVSQDTADKDAIAAIEAEQEAKAVEDSANADADFMPEVPDHVSAAALRDKEDAANAGGTEDDVEYPERGTIADVKAMKKFIKKLKDSQLKEWCELEGATYTAVEHESINRMRMAMAIKAIYFPETAPKAGSSKKSKYADYTTEQLVEMALENDITVKDDKGNMAILRMYTIMALKEAKILL